MANVETDPMVLDLDAEFEEEWLIRSAFWFPSMQVSDVYVRYPELSHISGGKGEETIGRMTVDHVTATQQKALELAAARYKAHLGEFATGTLLISSAMSLQSIVDLAFNTTLYPHLPPELTVTPHLHRILDEQGQ